MNILFLGDIIKDNFGGPYTQYEFEQTVGKYAACKYAGEGFPDHVAGETMNETVRRVMPDADWVIDDDKSYHIRKPKNRSYKVGVFINDLHGKHLYGIKNPVKWANMIMSADYDGVFMRHPLLYGTSYQPDVVSRILGGKAHWVPHSVNIDKFYKRGEVKYDVAFIGATYDCYPLRKIIYDNIFYVARGYRVLRGGMAPGGVIKKNSSKPGDHYLVGDDYAEALGSTRILIFDCSIYRYPLMKFFEGAASGCLVMSDAPSLGERLGFKHRETMVEVNLQNWEEALQFFLDNPDEAKKIADAGMKNTRKNHSHAIRSRQFVGLLKELSDGGIS